MFSLFWRTQVLFARPLTLLFWTSCDICPGFQSHSGTLCMLSHLCDHQIHLWCNTCWLHRSQHGSQAFLIHIFADRVSASIGGGSNPWLSMPQHSAVFHLVRVYVFFLNKKVLLHDRKRYTTHSIASLALLFLGEGGTAVLAGGTTVLPGYPPPMDGKTLVKTLPLVVLSTWAVITLLLKIERTFHGEYKQHTITCVIWGATSERILRHKVT